MVDASLVIRQADAGDVPAVVGLLVAAGLPIEGVADIQMRGRLLVATLKGMPGAEVIGAVAVEKYLPQALLCSLVVQVGYRRRSVGRCLLEAALDLAAALGAREAVILTDTAQGFFEHHGFEEVDRDLVTGPVALSPEFRRLCPESAVAMRKPLHL